MSYCKECGNAHNECECGDRKVSDFISGFDSLMDGLDSFLGPKVQKCGKCLSDIFLPRFRCSQCDKVVARCKLVDEHAICEVCASQLIVVYLCPCVVKRIAPRANSTHGAP